MAGRSMSSAQSSALLEDPPLPSCVFTQFTDETSERCFHFLGASCRDSSSESCSAPHYSSRDSNLRITRFVLLLASAPSESGVLRQ